MRPRPKGPETEARGYVAEADAKILASRPFGLEDLTSLDPSWATESDSECVVSYRHIRGHSVPFTVNS